MSEVKYTRGPWVVHREGIDGRELIVRSTVQLHDELDGGTYEPTIADLYRGGTGKEADANLIAAAPELLEALQIALAYIARRCGTPDPEDRFADQILIGMHKQIDSAIAKALGNENAN